MCVRVGMCWCVRVCNPNLNPNPNQDNWAAHKERLTYEQQELISDMLISPSFYA